ncbi:MAG: hypothetical protein HKN87_16035 [Saprospiraceae bacterium]|nr:hypothetical protein [Saprospiraceae bacterium]
MKTESLLTLFALLFVYSLTAQHSSLDPYGGTLSIEGSKTGFFHLQQIDGRSRLITPDGHAFFVLGINHINACEKELYAAVPDFMTEEVRKKRISNDLQSWKMNTCGYGCPDYLQDDYPYFTAVSFLSNAHYKPKQTFAFDDVFAAEFIENCKNKIREACLIHASNPNLVAYFWTDTPRWDIMISRDRHGEDWVSYIRNLGSESEGKHKYVNFLKYRYQDIDKFNLAYGLHFLDFEQLVDARFDHIDVSHPHILVDDYAFLEIIAEQLYHLLAITFKKYDGNHLLFGEKYIAGDHPDGVLKIAAKYVDAISIQAGPTMGPGPGDGIDEKIFNKIQFDHINNITGKSILVCDHAISFHNPDFPVTLWHQGRDEEAAGNLYQDYLIASASQPYILGYQRCQYIDFYDPQRGLLKQGLVDENGNRHGIYSKAIAQANQRALQIVYGSGK